MPLSWKLFPGALFPLYIFRAAIKAYIRQSRCLFLVRFHFIASFPLDTFFSSLFPSSSFRLGFHRADLITVAYRKGRFCTHVTGNMSLTPSIKVKRACDRNVVFHGTPLCQGHDPFCGAVARGRRSRSMATIMRVRTARVFIREDSLAGRDKQSLR